MNRKRLPILAALAFALASLNTTAAVLWPFTPGTITDNGSTDFTLSGADPFPGGISQINLTIDHPWVSDLTLTLFAPGTSLTGPADYTLFARLDTVNTAGEGADLSNAGTYAFAASGSDFVQAANTAPGGVIPHGVYQASVWSPVSSFGSGTWTLRAVDTSVNDIGHITQIELVAVPEPQSLALLAGLGLIGFAAYRRFSAKTA